MEGINDKASGGSRQYNQTEFYGGGGATGFGYDTHNCSGAGADNMDGHCDGYGNDNCSGTSDSYGVGFGLGDGYSSGEGYGHGYVDGYGKRNTSGDG